MTSATEKSDSRWAPIRVGLVNDPQHQARMGKAIWLYLHLQLYAHWSTGKGLGVIKCQDIADKTGRDERTIRRNLKKLEDENYINLTRAPYGFYFQITNWKPIKKVERSDISDQPESQNHPKDHPTNRPDKSVHSDGERSDKTVRSESGETGQKCPTDRTKVSNRPDKSVRSINRKCFKGLKRFKKTAVAGDENSVDRDIEFFWDYAGVTHRKFRDCELFDAGAKDRERVRAMLGKYSVRSLCIAWVWFLQSREKYIVDHYPSRNIAVFGGQLRNFIEPAEKKITKIKNQQAKRVKTREPTTRVIPVVDERWEKCLREIEAQILPENYSTLFEPLVFRGVKRGRGVIVCPSKFYRDCVVKNYGDMIAATMGTVFGKHVEPVILADTG